MFQLGILYTSSKVGLELVRLVPGGSKLDHPYLRLVVLGPGYHPFRSDGTMAFVP